jgi:hypothetical protein
LASNGLNLLINFKAIDGTDTLGYLLLATSSDGNTWSSPERLHVYDTSPEIYISGSTNDCFFGKYFDSIVDTSEEQEKIIVAVGAPSEDPSSVADAGEVFYVTGTMVNGSWQWSNKTSLYYGDSTDD